MAELKDRSADANGFSQRYSTIVQTVTVAALFVAGFWAGVINPLGNRLDHIETNELTLQVTLAEYREFHNRALASLDKMESEITSLRDSQVSRGEHVQKWASDEATFVSLQRQVDEIKRDFGSSYSLNDKIKELQQELNDVRRLNESQRKEQRQ